MSCTEWDRDHAGGARYFRAKHGCGAELPGASLLERRALAPMPRPHPDGRFGERAFRRAQAKARMAVDRFCGGVFKCARCRRIVGWCLGAADAHPDLCDDCANTTDALRRLAPGDPERDAVAIVTSASDLRDVLVGDLPDRATKESNMKTKTKRAKSKASKKAPPKRKAAAKAKPVAKATPRSLALASTAKPAVLAAGVAKFAKQHGLSPKEATAKLLSVAVGRISALAKYNAKPAKKSGKVAPKKAAKAKRSAKPAAAKPKPKAARKAKARAAKPKVVAKAKANGGLIQGHPPVKTIAQSMSH